MTNYSSLILLDANYHILKRKDFIGTEYLVTPIFAFYSQKYFQRDLFKEKTYDYLENLDDVMLEEDRLIKQLFDEKLISKKAGLKALKTLSATGRLPWETFLRLTGYITFLENNSGEFIIQQNSNAYPDVDEKIQNGKFQK